MTAYRCTLCGWKDFDAGLCPFCGFPIEAYEAGPPARQEGIPTVHGDKLPKHYDYAAGAWIDSKSQRDRIYRLKGLRVKSWAEHCRRHGNIPKEGVGYSYRGQKRHRTRAETRPP